MRNFQILDAGFISKKQQLTSKKQQWRKGEEGQTKILHS